MTSVIPRVTTRGTDVSTARSRSVVASSNAVIKLLAAATALPVGRYIGMPSRVTWAASATAATTQ